MANNNIRITKAQRYTDIIAILTGGEVQHNTTVDEAVEFLTSEREKLNKKSSTKSAKQTALQAENEKLKQFICQYLGSLPDDKNKVTCSDIIRNVPELSDYSNQKVTSLLTQLVDAGRAVRDTAKGGKVVFSLA